MNFAGIEYLLPLMSEEQKRRAYSDVPGLKGVFCRVFPYYCGRDEGNISLYARGEDYHKVVMKSLRDECMTLSEKHPGNLFVPYADISPYPEAAAAACAGLGMIGRNGLLITPLYGSFVFIGVIATDLQAECGGKLSYCENCGECAKACPGGAIGEEGICVSKCLSDMTQRKGELNLRERELIKASPTIWGCDVCQLSCPHNKEVRETETPGFREDLICSLSVKDLDLSARAFREKYKDRAFSWRGKGPLLRNLQIKEE